MLNHFVRANELCSKSSLTRNLRAYPSHPAVAKLGLPPLEAFYPRSYLLAVPGELRNLVEDALRQPWSYLNPIPDTGYHRDRGMGCTCPCCERPAS